MKSHIGFVVALVVGSLVCAEDAFGQCRGGGGGGGSPGTASMSTASVNPYLMSAAQGYSMGSSYSPVMAAYQQQMMMQQAYAQQVAAQRAYVKQQRSLKESEGRRRLLAEAKERDARRMGQVSQYSTPLLASIGK